MSSIFSRVWPSSFPHTPVAVTDQPSPPMHVDIANAGLDGPARHAADEGEAEQLIAWTGGQLAASAASAARTTGAGAPSGDARSGAGLRGWWRALLWSPRRRPA